MSDDTYYPITTERLATLPDALHDCDACGKRLAPKDECFCPGCKVEGEAIDDLFDRSEWDPARYQQWEPSCVASSAKSSIEKLREYHEVLVRQPPYGFRPTTIILPDAPHGMTQRARRRRRVRLSSGAMIELPDGMHPIIFAMAGPDEQAQMLARHFNVQRLNEPPLMAWGVEVHTSPLIPRDRAYAFHDRRP